MVLKYVGPKPIISHRGIEFDQNKEDKYVYLGIVVELIKALDHKYIEDKKYIYKETKDLSSLEIIKVLKKYCKNLDDLLDKTKHDIEDEIKDNIDRANESETLSDIDKEVLTNNLNMMHDYMIQRAINKSVYYCAMNVLADIVKRDHIDYITTPMMQKYVHVLHSLQGSLLKEKFPIDTELDIYKEKDELFATLKVITQLV
jgi:hypothetical protein